MPLERDELTAYLPLDIFFDWDKLDRSSVRGREMTINNETLENICLTGRKVTVLIAKPFRFDEMKENQNKH